MKVQSLTLGVLMLFGLLLAACSTPAAPAETNSKLNVLAPTSVSSNAAASAAGDAKAGKTKFEMACVACHGPDAKGIPNLGKNLTTNTFVKGLSDVEFVDFLKKGRPARDKANTTGIEMPPKGGNPTLSDGDLSNIVAYVRTLNKE